LNTGIVAVLQARMGSTRYSGKVLAPLRGEPMVAHIMRSMRALDVDESWLVTSDKPADDVLVVWARAFGFKVYRGDEHNVYARFKAVISEASPDYLVRVCGDMPLLNATMSNRLIKDGTQGSFDYATWCTKSGHPACQTRIGMLPEVVKAEALLRVEDSEQTREHVTYGLYCGHAFSVLGLVMPHDLEGAGVCLSVDHPVDADRVAAVVDICGQIPQNYRQIARVLEERPELRVGGILKPYSGALHVGKSSGGAQSYPAE
jgi:spore coat polysaccharide biosynthesis protein SpsF